MHMPVVVGIILAIILMVAFSEWFYHMVTGWREIVIDDIYFKYRVVTASLVSMSVIVATFLGMAYVTECPNQDREGVFAQLNCEEYLKIKAGTEKIFGEKNQTLENLNY